MYSSLGLILAIAIPLIFLYAIREFDFYQSGRFHLILICLVWGGAASILSAVTLSTLLRYGLTTESMAVHTYAPIYEEVFKSLILLYLVWRTRFTYSVDGALYGFAVGIGFAIFENLEYINYYPSEAIQIALQRIFTTNLVHALSTAAVGITLGASRLEASNRRKFVPALGLLLAMGQHWAYNNIIGRNWPQIITYLPGVPGLYLVIFFMQRGKDQAREWIRANLGMADRVTRGEVAVIDRLAGPGEVLLPVKERFGDATAGQMEKLLYLQARLGIKRKALDSLPETSINRAGLEVEVDEMRADMQKIERKIGAYVMLFVRGLFTDEMISVWDRIQVKIQEQSAAKGGQKGGGLWTSLDERLKPLNESERLNEK